MIRMDSKKVVFAKFWLLPRHLPGSSISNWFTGAPAAEVVPT
jgi:hypothetical protein